MKAIFTILGGLIALAAVLTPVAAWITHVIYCIKTASYVFLLAGGLIFPIGVIHGVGLWIGAW